MRLYETTAQLRAVQDWIDANEDAIRAADGVLPDEVAALLDAAEGAFTDKVERVALYLRELTVEAEAIRDEADRLFRRADARLGAAKGLKDYLRRCLETANVSKVDGQLVSVAVQPSPPRVLCTLNLEDESARDALAGWWEGKVTYRLKAHDVLAAHNRGAPLPMGVAVVRGTHVRIR